MELLLHQETHTMRTPAPERWPSPLLEHPGQMASSCRPSVLADRLTHTPLGPPAPYFEKAVCGQKEPWVDLVPLGGSDV